MTAIGIALMILGFTIVNLTDDSFKEDIGTKIFIIGMWLAAIGAVTFVWRVMP